MNSIRLITCAIENSDVDKVRWMLANYPNVLSNQADTQYLLELARNNIHKRIETTIARKINLDIFLQQN